MHAKGMTLSLWGSLTSLFSNLKNLILKPEGFFLIFASVFGCLLVFLTPPIQVPDEQSHFIQAYHVSNLNFIPDQKVVDGKIKYGAEVPSSILESTKAFKDPTAGNPTQEFETHLFKQYIDQPLDSSRREFKEGSAYAPVVYIPQATGVLIGRITDASPLMMIWIGRIINLLTWILLVYFAIKILPFAKWGMVVLALNPVAVFFSASLSADVVGTGLAFLFFALIISFATSKERDLDPKQLWLIGLVLLLLSLTKPVSILLSLLLFLIPWRKFGSRKKYILICAAFILMTTLIAFGWGVITQEANTYYAQFQNPEIGISPPLQLKDILTNPIGYIFTLFKNYIFVARGFYGDAVFTTYFGVFGWLDTWMPLWTIAMYIIVLLLTLLYQMGRGSYLTAYNKIFLALVFVLLFIANVTAMYIYYTPIGGSVISGVQGRYFIPASVLILGIFTYRKKILLLSESTMVITVFAGMFTVLSMMLLKIAARYYF